MLPGPALCRGAAWKFYALSFLAAISGAAAIIIVIKRPSPSAGVAVHTGCSTGFSVCSQWRCNTLFGEFRASHRGCLRVPALQCARVCHWAAGACGLFDYGIWTAHPLKPMQSAARQTTSSALLWSVRTTFDFISWFLHIGRLTTKSTCRSTNMRRCVCT